jgi:hypothetical protein
MSEPQRDDDYRPRSLLQVLYGNSRRWIYIGALIVVLLILRWTGNL